MRTSKPITVTLGKQQPLMDARLKSGDYESASEIVRAGLRALDREEPRSTKLCGARFKLPSTTPGVIFPPEMCSRACALTMKQA